MKKVYSLVNITKAKDQEAVQSICIKVFCFGSAVTLFMGKVFELCFGGQQVRSLLYLVEVSIKFF